MENKQSKPREVREELRDKGRVIINIYRSILPFLPSLPSILTSRVMHNTTSLSPSLYVFLREVREEWHLVGLLIVVFPFP